MSNGDKFYEEMKEQSHIKAEIVKKYFSAWAKVLLPSVERRDGKLGYIDLFAGPGVYEDGTKSTPILVIEEALKDQRLIERLVTLFNDKNIEYITSLRREIENIPKINLLRHKPNFYNDSVGNQLAKIFQEIKFIPSLFFIDPWGYKGLSLSLLKSVLKDWGCDCIFFFNYNRINMGLSNPFFDDHINAIFGDERAIKLKEEIKKLKSNERELTIIEELGLAISDLGFPHILPFCFKDESNKKTSHYLIFITKHIKGYEIMKEIMAKYSSESNQGVPSFEYCPATIKQAFLFSFRLSLEDLKKMLLDEFKGESLKMIDIFKRHHVGKPFIIRNYKQVLLNMEEAGLIKAEPPISKRKGGTFADDVMVIFTEK